MYYLEIVYTPFFFEIISSQIFALFWIYLWQKLVFELLFDWLSENLRRVGRKVVFISSNPKKCVFVSKISWIMRMAILSGRWFFKHIWVWYKLRGHGAKWLSLLSICLLFIPFRRSDLTPCWELSVGLSTWQTWACGIASPTSFTPWRGRLGIPCSVQAKLWSWARAWRSETHLFSLLLAACECYLFTDCGGREEKGCRSWWQMVWGL